MRRSQVLYDGLRRCLYPGVDNAGLREALRGPLCSYAHTRPSLRSRTPGTLSRTQDRCLGSTRSPLREGASSVVAQSTGDARAESRRRNLEILTGPEHPRTKNMETMPTEDLITALYQLRDPRAHGISSRRTNIHDRILLLVRRLLRKHDHPLNLFIYECMLDAMAAPEGSAAGVAALLGEMSGLGVPPDASACRRALAALAVHPDYVLRQKVLEEMRERWFTVDRASQQFVALGLLRDGQYEMAYEKLEAMQRDGHGAVDTWVLDVFVLVFGRLGFLDEMLQIFIDRKQADATDAAYPSLAYYVLDVCSAAYQYQGTALAWTLTVRNGALKPSDGMLDNVLATAAREGDMEMANDVISLLSERGQMKEQHWDALVEAFAARDDLEGAIRTAVNMARCAIQLDRSHARPIHLLLLREAHLLAEAPGLLWSLAGHGRLPAAIVDAVVEALATTRGSEAAMGLYESMESLTGQPDHDVGTIEAMIVRCGSDTKLAARLVSDHRQRAKAATPPTMSATATGGGSWATDSLIYTLLDMDEVELATYTAQVYTEEHAGRRDLTMAWLGMLAHKAMEAKDTGIWDLVKVLNRAGQQGAVDTIMTVDRQRRTTTTMTHEAVSEQ